MTSDPEFDEAPDVLRGAVHPELDIADIEAQLRLQQFHLRAAIRERKLSEVAQLAAELAALVPDASPDAAIQAAATIWQTDEIVAQMSLLDLLKDDPDGQANPADR